MNRPDNLFEAASYDLLRFRERRLADRRLTPRAGPDRRMQSTTLPSSIGNNTDGDTEFAPRPADHS